MSESTFNPQIDQDKVFHWFTVCSQPHQESKLAERLTEAQKTEKNIIEVFCPINTTVTVRRNGKDVKAPLYTGHVFVYATYQALNEYLRKNFPSGVGILFTRTNYESATEQRQVLPLVIPEEQMRMFREFNDSYNEQMVVLDRPYSDYAFNPKNGKYNEVVKIMDGSFAGRKGYLVRFDGERRLVFNILNEKDLPSLTVCIPNIWNFHVLRLQNAGHNRVGKETERDRAIDQLLGTIQACGKSELSLPALGEVLTFLCNKTSWVSFCKFLNSHGEREMSESFSEYTKQQVNQVFNLIRYENENPGYVMNSWKRNFIRPFLTPVYGGANLDIDEDEVRLLNVVYEELIRKVDIEEDVFYPDTQEEKKVTTTYCAHIGRVNNICFANWDKFLAAYFKTAKTANRYLVDGRGREKLVESFRNYAPTLYKVLRDPESPVKAKEDFLVGTHQLNVLYIEVKDDSAEAIAQAEQTLITTGVKICQEINTTTHLAIWRRYLCSVWLHL